MYNFTMWQDHVTEFDNRYREHDNPDGTITHVPDEGEVLQEGTPQNARNFNNIETGIFAASELGAELARIALQQGRAIDRLIGESGIIALTNTLVYPFNNSAKTVPIKNICDTAEYTVDIDTGNERGAGQVVVYDKLRNGFKIAYTGGAKSVTVRYTIRGGIL